jgi:metal-responsive CopG/Arc/MetJ family transcriptional regulator
MKTAISIPDRVYARAEKTAKRLGKSRSQLYAEAVAEYVARHDPDETTDTMNRVCDAVDTRADQFMRAAAGRILRGTAW